MDLIFIVTSAHNHLFHLFYLAAFATVVFYFLIIGISKNQNMFHWSLAIAAGVLFFLIGNKLFTYSFYELTDILSAKWPEKTGAKTVLGGLAGAFTGGILVSKWLKIKESVLDVLAIALPIGMAIQRMGCFFGGCC